jgi:Ca-activated chloride channel homolog
MRDETVFFSFRILYPASLPLQDSKPRLVPSNVKILKEVKNPMRKIICASLLTLLFSVISFANVTQGELNAVTKDGKSAGLVPLKHTKVEAEISGFLSRVKVTQEFENNFNEKIEAIYVFPLPNNAAVDDMLMRIGERTVRGKIMKREEAREVYEAARSNGQIASLLDQERPNIFTQSVANILPGEKIVIEISYVETLKYEDGSYEFVFPMVVGPRYIPGNATGKTGGGFAPDTDRVPDASKITPMPAKERAGHDISVNVKLDAGVLVENVASKTHEIDSQMLSGSSYNVELKSRKTIPNKDFVLKYDVAGGKIEDAVLTHRGRNGGYFTMILQPPDKVNTEDVTPKEIVFVIDTSGSMSGFPLDKAKESMQMALDGLHPQDTFNLITFAGDTHVLFEKPVPANRENLAKAQAFLKSRQGGGGTEMMKAIQAALKPSGSPQHVRIVCFMTDGYIGNEGEILSEIQKNPGARIFSFGIGSSVNRFLLDKMAEEGRGEVEYVALTDDGSKAAKRFHERVRSPLLTDISLEFEGVEVADVYPKRINDLFSAKPVIVHGRYTKGGKGKIRLKGKSFGRDEVREIPVNFPDKQPAHDVLATLWARTKIDDLMSSDYRTVQGGNAAEDIVKQITSLGIEYRLMTQYTSFVAVEERVVTDGGTPRRIEVPVEMPEGVSYEGVFGEKDDYAAKESPKKYVRRTPSAVGSGYGRRDMKSKGEVSNQPSPVDLVTTVNERKVTVTDREVAEELNDLDGLKAVSIPKPVVPTAPKNADGNVRVGVTLDQNGRVTAAKAVSGDKAFHQAAVDAARKAKFEVPALSLEIKKITGEIFYRFAGGRVDVPSLLQNVEIEVKPNKYHSQVRDLVSGKTAAANFVQNGKAGLIVRVDELKPETIAAMKALGFEVLTEMASARAVVGRIAVEKIAALAELEAVTYISPQQ